METLLIDLDSFSLSQRDFFIRLAVALGIGAVIGLERQYSAMNENSTGFSGIRTFVILTLMGFTSGIFYHLFSIWIYAAILLGIMALIASSYWYTASQGDRGLTTELTSIFAFLMGTLVLHGYVEICLTVTVILVVVLSSKFRLKAIVGKITPTELYDFILFVVLALLVLPFLPNQTFGPAPFDVINPREIGWVIILTSGLGLLGHILIKFLGANSGILLSGILGGLVSSTAVTWIFSKKSKENKSLSSQCATAILAASSIMFFRVLIWTFIFNANLFTNLLPALVFILGSGMGITFYIYKKKYATEIKDAEIPLGKPMDLKGALVFGLIYVAILLIVSYANQNLGTAGTLISSAIAGLSDVDAITISASKLAEVKLDINTASLAILIAVMTNTLVKLGIASYAGSKELRKLLFLGYGVLLVSSLISILLLL
ncbi:MgtC/SapB family protein [Algoriphagus mannitolivorans]|uniref:MgtC/SapB family protein n=1 Tax=Algoriphagus mannitolivorans TaxID=226504 RepID=UPI0003F551CF|nr:MgtC/SapB family protein [Algoriphagus mannitolivorans]